MKLSIFKKACFRFSDIIGVLVLLIVSLYGQLGSAASAFLSFSPNIHGEITSEAIANFNSGVIVEGRNLGAISARAMAVLIDANYHADYDEVSISLSPKILVPNNNYNPAHHCDRNEGEGHLESFQRAFAYYFEQSDRAIAEIQARRIESGLRFLGRACHVVQDMFSHTNLVDIDERIANEVSHFVSHDDKFPGYNDTPQIGFSKVMVTGYSRRTGGSIPGDTYSHDEHCKDGTLTIAGRSYPQGESNQQINPEYYSLYKGRMPTEVYRQTKFGLARELAVNATTAALFRVYYHLGDGWPGVMNFHD